MLTGAKSFRTYYDKELIAFEKDEAAVRGEYFASERDVYKRQVFYVKGVKSVTAAL